MADSATVDFSFDARCLPVLAPFLPKKDPRRYLSGIFVKPLPSCGVIVAATDGKFMGLYYDKDGRASEDVILNVSKGALAACMSRSIYTNYEAKRLAVMRNSHLSIIDTDGRGEAGGESENELFIQVGNPVIEGKYPEIWRVIPDSVELKNGCSGVIDVYRLTVLEKAFNGARKSGLIRNSLHSLTGCGVRLFSAGEERITVARINGLKDFNAFIMPMHDDSSDSPSGAMHPAFESLRPLATK